MEKRVAWHDNTSSPVMQLNEADTIKVAIRVRPLNNTELEKGASPVLQVAEDSSYVKVPKGACMGCNHISYDL